MRTVKPYPKTNNVEIDRATLRFAGTLLRAYRDELCERLGIRRLLAPSAPSVAARAFTRRDRASDESD